MMVVVVALLHCLCSIALIPHPWSPDQSFQKNVEKDKTSEPRPAYVPPCPAGLNEVRRHRRVQRTAKKIASPTYLGEMRFARTSSRVQTRCAQAGSSVLKINHNPDPTKFVRDRSRLRCSGMAPSAVTQHRWTRGECRAGRARRGQLMLATMCGFRQNQLRFACLKERGGSGDRFIDSTPHRGTKSPLNTHTGCPLLLTCFQ